MVMVMATTTRWARPQRTCLGRPTLGPHTALLDRHMRPCTAVVVELLVVLGLLVEL
jgi:hypothetical protein